MKITVYAKTDIAGSRCSITFDIPDADVTGADGEVDTTKVEVLAAEAKDSLIEWGWFEGEDRSRRGE